MIDFRIMTFIDICESRSFTKTAKNLSITQPAVTQHIKYLEEHYQSKLIEYKGKKMIITPAGEILLKYALKTKALLNETEGDLNKLKTKITKINFGATLTIGEFIMPSVLKGYIKENKDIRLNFIVDNTKKLIEKLQKGDIEFAFIEGYFDKGEFEHYLFKKDEFVLAVSSQSELAKKSSVEMDDIKDERLILREKGSGSRDILEKLLANKNYSLNKFENRMEIGHVKVIKEMVKANLGVTFIYKEAIKEEIENNTIVPINISNINLEKEFNFIFSKDTLHSESYMEFYNFSKSIL